MKNNEFMTFAKSINKYLEANKSYTLNEERFNDFKDAVEIAFVLFKDMNISSKEDPLQLGSLICCIDGFDIVIRGHEEISLFKDLISKADNFEIYPAGNEKIKISIMFNSVFDVTIE